MIEFRFPDIGEGIAEGVILKWFVEVGQEVKEGDSLFLVETDKVNAEIPSPASGIILARFGEEGETINVGDVVVQIGEAGTQAKAEPAAEGDSGAVVGALETSNQVLAASSEHAQSPAEPARPRALATPVARKLAKDLGVDINALAGSGPGGRVMKEDILRAAEAEQQPIPPAAPAPAAPQPAAPIQGLEERVALTTLGKTVARNMALSKREIPHAAVMDEFDVTELVQLRQQAKVLAEQEDARLTYMPFIIKAAVLALREFPLFNASFSAETEEIILKKYYNMGIAVDTPDGLLVPVIKNADQKGLLQIARELQTLAEKARERTLSLEEIQGGTFTLTNYGAVGALAGVPVIKHPEAAILGIGSITRRPVAAEDNQIAIRQILPVTLSFDHRFIDGGSAGRFIKRLRAYLEQPLLLLLS
ncbi:MAG TPA: dihydrolipoamide acetyltransferase family protein [Limnochordia bacterium]|nr:dihydrolipoamide acetyltransferase family protein [Limnochordia bacterium]